MESSMPFSYDHDYHVHSYLSRCSKDPQQTPQSLLEAAEKNGLKELCLTDHFWDEQIPGASPFYSTQGFSHVSQSLPLPQSEKVRFYFGCEAEMDKHLTLGISPRHFEDFDFVIVSTTHLHMTGFTVDEHSPMAPKDRARLWLIRLEALLKLPLPFHKIGLAHPVCRLINSTSRPAYLDTLNAIPTRGIQELFSQAAKVKMGIELNGADLPQAPEEEQTLLRIYRIAKDCGCKFYLGSDSHRNPSQLCQKKAAMEAFVARLGLTQKDRFRIGQK